MPSCETCYYISKPDIQSRKHGWCIWGMNFAKGDALSVKKEIINIKKSQKNLHFRKNAYN